MPVKKLLVMELDDNWIRHKDWVRYRYNPTFNINRGASAFADNRQISSLFSSTTTINSTTTILNLLTRPESGHEEHGNVVLGVAIVTVQGVHVRALEPITECR